MGLPQSGMAAGERVGRYHVIGKIAQGGMAEVLLAKLVGPQGFERPVVIKRILPALANDQKFVRMFLDEAKLISGIRHPNVVQVQELSGEQDYFLVMEYLAGESVSSLMKRLALKRKRLPFAVCAHIIAEACSGLHAAHELRGADGQLRNVVHRDISPQNLFVTYDGTVKVIDFGIAKATDRITKTEAGQLKGKFAYMAPESCRGAQIDRRTDLFSLTTVLYELSTGTRLFVRSTDMKTLEAVCYDPIRRPSHVIKDYAPELEAVVMKGLERDPQKRYLTAAEMRRDLVRVAHQLEQGALPEEQLRNAMQSLFEDRIREKSEMLQRVKVGAAANVPTGEVESEVSIPVVIDEKTGGVTGPSVTGLRPVTMRGEPAGALAAPGVGSARNWLEQQEPWKFILAAIGFVVLGAVAAWALLRSDTSPAGMTASELPGPSAVHAAARTKVLPAVIDVMLDTTPSGAAVNVDGVYRGVTPITLHLPRSEGAVAVEFSMQGYRTMTEAIVPNSSQRLGFVLELEGGSSKRVSRRPSPPSSKPSAPAATTTKPANPASKPAKDDGNLGLIR